MQFPVHQNLTLSQQLDLKPTTVAFWGVLEALHALQGPQPNRAADPAVLLTAFHTQHNRCPGASRHKRFLLLLFLQYSISNYNLGIPREVKTLTLFVFLFA